MSYNRDVTGLQSTLAMIERIRSPQQLQQIAQQYQNKPNGGAIIAAALAQAQKLKELQSGMAPSNNAGQNTAPVADEAINSIDPRALPEDTGIARIPAPNIANMAEGGIVAFAGGGARIPKGDRTPSFDEALDVEGVKDPRERAFLKALHGQESGGGRDTSTSNRGAVGHMQILPGTFKEVADPNMDINNPFDNMRAGIRYGRKGFAKAKGDPVLAGAYYYGGPGGLAALAQGEARKDPQNPTYPDTRQYGQSVARRLTALLPIGSAQAGEPSPKDVPANTAQDSTGAGGLTPTLSGLGAAAPAVREAFTPSFRPGTTAAQAVGRTALTAAPLAALGAIGGGLSAGAANALSNATPEQLGQLQNDIGSDTGISAAILNPENRGPEVTAKQMPYGEQMRNALGFIGKAAVLHPDVTGLGRDKESRPYASELRSGIQAEDKQGAAGFAQPPEELPMSEKKMVGLAKEAIPASERKGWTDDMLMQFFLSMMAGQSPNALANIGAAGLGALKYGQEAKKAELEREKDRQAIRGSEAEVRYKTAQAQSLESEEKTDSALRMKAATLAQQELEKWQALPQNFSATPAQVAAKRQELFSIYTAALRQQDTMGAGTALDLSKWGSLSKI